MKILVIFGESQEERLPEGLVQMLDQKINNNTFIFEVEDEEEREMLKEEICLEVAIDFTFHTI